MGTVLLAVVKVQATRCSVLHNGLIKRVLYNALLHVVVELTVDNVPGTIVNQAAEICGFLLAVNRQHRAVFNIALPEVEAVLALEPLGSVAGILVYLHHAG